MVKIVTRGDPTPWPLRVIHDCIGCGTVYLLEEGDAYTKTNAVIVSEYSLTRCPVCDTSVRTNRPDVGRQNGSQPVRPVERLEGKAQAQRQK